MITHPSGPFLPAPSPKLAGVLSPSSATYLRRRCWVQACLRAPGRGGWWSEGHGEATGPRLGSHLQPAAERAGHGVTRGPEPSSGERESTTPHTHTEEGAEPSCPLGLREGLPSRQDSLAPGVWAAAGSKCLICCLGCQDAPGDLGMGDHVAGPQPSRQHHWRETPRQVTR